MKKNNNNNNIKWTIEIVNILFTTLSEIINSNINTLTNKNAVIKYLKANKNSNEIVNLINKLNNCKLEKITAYYYNSNYIGIQKRFDNKISKEILDICFFNEREEKVKW